MNNVLKILVILSLSFISFSCSKNEVKKDSKELYGDLSDLPEWVLSPKSDQGVTAVGIASPSRGGIKFQIPKAELDGKANIASIIQSKISRITKNSLRSAQVNDSDDVEDFFSQATKSVIKDLPLSGVKRINTFMAKDGTLYVQMLLTNEDYSKFIENSQKTFDSLLNKSDLARNNIDKAKQASDELFEELENE